MHLIRGSLAISIAVSLVFGQAAQLRAAEPGFNHWLNVGIICPSSKPNKTICIKADALTPGEIVAIYEEKAIFNRPIRVIFDLDFFV
jgi:hypothetical protein